MPNPWTGKGNPYTRQEVLDRLRATLAKGQPIIAAGAGTGISAKFIERGGADLIPGPNSTEMAIHLGFRRGGWPGLCLAGLAFIVPPALLVTACAWAYVTFGKLPVTAALLAGVKPAVLVIIANAVVDLTRGAVKNTPTAAIALAAATLALLGVHELLVLLLAAVAALALRPGRPTVALAAEPFSLAALFLFFAKVGSVLYGGGYVLLAFLRADLVDRWHWLTEAQLLDAVAIGQITPGPLFTTATFIGYLLAGPAGAALATAGIFLPAFVFVAISGLIIPRLRQSPAAAAVLDGVNAASLALMAVVTLQLGRAALVDIPSLAIAALAALALLRWRWNTALIVLAAAVLGIAITALNIQPTH